MTGDAESRRLHSVWVIREDTGYKIQNLRLVENPKKLRDMTSSNQVPLRQNLNFVNMLTQRHNQNTFVATSQSQKWLNTVPKYVLKLAN